MSPRTAAAIGAFALVAAALATRRAADVQAQSYAQAPADAGDAGDGDGDGLVPLDYINPIGAIERQVEQYQTEAAMRDTNVPAFLSLIAYSEGTDQRADPYRVCYSYRHTIESFADHPAVTGEWRGEPLDSLGPAYVGKVSTAAGRYQIIKPTWLSCKRALGLADFSPASQDAAAVYLVKRRGALDAVQAGDIERAVYLCRAEWASLPGNEAGQPQRRLASLIDAYSAAGGYVA